MRVTVKLFVICTLIAGPAAIADWTIDKAYQADNTDPQLVTTDLGTGSYRGWALSETGGTWGQALPGLVGGLPAESDTVINGKLKYSTAGRPWTFSTAPGTVTALKWGVYMPSAGRTLGVAMPAMQIGTGGYINKRFRLDFKSGLATPTGIDSGWVEADGTVIEQGGKLRSDGKRYLPMPMDSWHTIRFEVSPDVNKPGGYRFDAWLDEQEGTGDVLHVGGRCDTTSGAAYVQWGAISTISGNISWATNYFAWGQNGDITPIDSSNAVDCNDPANCGDPVCQCTPVDENTLTACGNGLDDDADGLIDCYDPDCAAIAHCGDDQPHYALTLVRQVGHWQNNCAPWCGNGIFVSVHDEFGNPLDDVVVSDPLRGVGMTTAPDPGQGPDGQSGHARYTNVNGLTGTYRFHVAGEPGRTVVSSDVTPDLISDVLPDGRAYRWQLEFLRKSRRSSRRDATPQEPMYIFDDVGLNQPGGNNPSLDRDHAVLLAQGGEMYGQTFVADHNRIVSARVELTRGFLQTFQYQLSVHELNNDPPASLADIGDQIGATFTGPANMIDSEWWTQMVLWPLEGPDSVPVVPGRKYFLKIRRSDSNGGAFPFINAFLSDGNYYSRGMAFRQPEGTNELVNDGAGYDVVGYIVGVSTEPLCKSDPVFDVAGGGEHGNEPDGAVDSKDFGVFQACLTGPNPVGEIFDHLSQQCRCMDVTADKALDLDDFDNGENGFQQCVTGPTPATPLDPACDD